MRFKLFILGMFAAAAMISCNNEVINETPDDEEIFSGESTYATISLDFARARTYGGESEWGALVYEKAVHDVAVYVYKFEGSLTPEAMAYVPVAALPTPQSVTLRVKSGEKKIFMALNIANTPTPILENNSGVWTGALAGTHENLLDTGKLLSTSFAGLNRILYSTPASFQITPLLPAGSTEGGSAGLIKTFNGGSISSATGSLWSTSPPPAQGSYCFMSNWDGPDDVNTNASYTYLSKCYIKLKPNISKDRSKSGADNWIEIPVQRAYAKISLRISANGDQPNTDPGYFGTPTRTYLTTSDGGGAQGRFEMWAPFGAATGHVGVWVLGGINKSEFPFQQFAGIYKAVASPNYLLSYGDTIHARGGSGAGSVANQSDKWYDSYDNTRVFGTGKRYYTPLNTVTSVRDTMTKVQLPAGTLVNCMPVSPPNNELGNNNYAMCTENGTEFFQVEDRSTFVVFGGTYKPRNVITALLRNVNPDVNPWIGYNLQPAIAGTIDNGKGSTGYEYPNLTYASPDSLFYFKTSKLFIWGSGNLAKYYAWQLKFDKDNATPSLTTAGPVNTAFNADVTNNELICYYNGQCFYRVFIKDANAETTSSEHDAVLVRRNHVYDINIRYIKGPGIGDPNKIINPKEPVPEVYTFLTAEIKILDWHVVSQAVDNLTFK